MTTRTLFLTLAAITTDLQAETARLRFSPHRLALEALRERLDRVIDAIVDEGIIEREEGEGSRGREGGSEGGRE